MLSISASAKTESLNVEKIDVESYVLKALQHDVSYLASQIDADIANIGIESSDNLYRGVLLASPFSRSYKVLEPDSFSTSRFEEKGYKLGYTQFLPTGTQLSLITDQYSENTRTSAFAKKQGYSIALNQPILKNYFGASDRLNADYFSMAAQSTNQQSQLAKNAACVNAVDRYVMAWVSTEKQRFSNEMLSLAGELYKKSGRSRKSGQIGYLDWLGVQSEYLNQKNLSAQLSQTVNEAITNLKAQLPGLKSPQLVDPSNTFIKIFKGIDINNIADKNLQIEQMNSSIKALEYKVQSEEKSALPDLDLKVEKNSSSGLITNDKYRDDELSLALNLIWKLNDESVSAQSKISKLELQKLKYQYEELLRNRKLNIETRYKNIISQFQQIDFEKERSLILSKITEENKKRFLQGRIEFQDFLRTKEQFLFNQNSYLDKQAQIWKILIDFILNENLDVSFCRGAK